MIVIHRDYGLALIWPRAYNGSADRRNRLSIRDERYAIGHASPNYPVPATLGYVSYHLGDMISIQHPDKGWIEAWYTDGSHGRCESNNDYDLVIWDD